ncbi:MAG: methyl-accepting chemotaxis protein [Treponema sp.]|jgi:methyl-accepting chemotaxis protein|nr:methyl-accepting chemotaxis protein [Treponema sp.]
MIFNNMKITTKLIISTAAFLAPIALMLYLVISVSNSSVQSAKNELRGTARIRPVTELLRLIPQYIGSADDRALGDVSALNDRIEQEFSVLVELLKGGPNQGQQADSSANDGTYLAAVSYDMLKSMRLGNTEETLKVHMNITGNMIDILSYTGGTYGLLIDPEMNTHYLIDIVLNFLPQAQERCVRVENIIRLAAFRQSLSGEDKKELETCLALLGEIDYQKANAVLKTISGLYPDSPAAADGSETENIFSYLSAYRASLYRLAVILERALSVDSPERFFPILTEQLSRINESIFPLFSITLDQLDVLLQNRIYAFYIRLVRSLLLAILASILAFFIIIMTNVSISQSTANLKLLFGSLQNNDLSAVLEVDSLDEFGELMTAFNRFLEKLRAAFVSFSHHASMVSSSVYDLSASAKEISATANEQSSSVAEIVATMEDNKNLSRQAVIKTEEVVELIEQTQKISRRGAELRDINQDMMQDIRDQNAKIIEEIMNLADMLNRIDETIGIIDSITDQTKLIAFNASLEASSSGEEGARFAVVAGEIRRFADSVAESTGEIKEKIEELQNAFHILIEEANEGSQQITHGYDSMVEQKTVFENIVEVSENVATRSRQISNLSKQQELASSQIFQALTEISAGVKQFVTATASTSKTADNLNVMSIELQETVKKYRTGEKG